MRLLVVALASFLVACASGPKEEPPERPFIKLANRRMALFVFWRGAPEPGFAETLERRLTRRIAAAYHTRPHVRRYEGEYAGLAPTALSALAMRRVDDVVVIEAGRDGETVAGRVVVQPVAGEKPFLAFDVPPITGKDGAAPDAERVADFVTLKLTHHWTDPAAAPALDLRVVATRLAAKGACDEALELYRLVYAHKGSGQVTELEADTTARGLQQHCESSVALREAVEKDRRAQFEVALDAAGMAKHYAAALQSAAAKIDLAAKLRPHTAKPVRISVRPGALIADLRYEPQRYKSLTSGRPKYEREYPVLYLDGFVPVMRALISLRKRLAAEVPPYERPNVEKLAMTLHLRRVLGDYAEIDFADRGRDVLLSDAVRVRMGQRDPVEVQSANQRVSRTKRMLLGPPRTPEGSLTTYGLVSEFFELEP